MLDPVTEAYARVRLRQSRARPVRQNYRDIGEAARKALRTILKETGSPLSKLKSRWPAIVGDRLAAICRPEKLTAGKTGRVLTLRVLPAAATLIQHQSATIRERVSVAAGGDVQAIKIVQGPLPGVAPKAKRRPRSLTAEERAWLEGGVAKIEDPALQAAIVALGRAMLTDDQDDKAEQTP